MADRQGKVVNTTYLDVKTAMERGQLHRDHLAHAKRWGMTVDYTQFVMEYDGPIKAISQIRRQGLRVMDVGCGKRVPLIEVFYTNKMGDQVDYYLGIDMSKLEMPEMLKGSKVEKKTHLLTLDVANNDALERKISELSGPPNVVTCFEVAEHVEIEHWQGMLSSIFSAMMPGGVFIMSTPNFNGQAAANHVNEMYHHVVGATIEDAGFLIDEVYGTFINIADAVKGIQRNPERYGQGALNLYDDCRRALGTNALSNAFAGPFPDLARNAIWFAKRPEGEEEMDSYVRRFKPLAVTPRPWGSSEFAAPFAKGGRKGEETVSDYDDDPADQPATERLLIPDRPAAQAIRELSERSHKRTEIVYSGEKLPLGMLLMELPDGAMASGVRIDIPGYKADISLLEWLTDLVEQTTELVTQARKEQATKPPVIGIIGGPGSEATVQAIVHHMASEQHVVVPVVESTPLVHVELQPQAEIAVATPEPPADTEKPFAQMSVQELIDEIIKMGGMLDTVTHVLLNGKQVSIGELANYIEDTSIPPYFIPISFHPRMHPGTMTSGSLINVAQDLSDWIAKMKAEGTLPPPGERFGLNALTMQDVQDVLIKADKGSTFFLPQLDGAYSHANGFMGQDLAAKFGGTPPNKLVVQWVKPGTKGVTTSTMEDVYHTFK